MLGTCGGVACPLLVSGGVSVHCCVNRVSPLVLGSLEYPLSCSLFMRDVSLMI
jgi:hypothetical protein